MYEYKFVSCKLGGFFQQANHEDIIKQVAKEGWRLVQVLPIRFNNYGKPTESQIIFERESQN